MRALRGPLAAAAGRRAPTSSCHPTRREPGRTSGFLLDVEQAREIHLVERDGGFPAHLVLGLPARRLAGRFLESVGELEAEYGERLRVGLSLVGAGERAVDARGEAHEDALGELDVRILRRRGGRFGGGVGGAHGASLLLSSAFNCGFVLGERARELI